MLFADFTPFVLFKPLKLICNVMICLSFLGAKVTETEFFKLFFETSGILLI